MSSLSPRYVCSIIKILISRRNFAAISLLQVTSPQVLMVHETPASGNLFSCSRLT
jgi:hypothetical protein